MVLFVFWIGIFPNTFLSFLHPTVQHLVDRLNTPGVQVAAQKLLEGALK
jgi:NADH:ubiquinone oxidoreductase subunit 4 (subunit M)